MLWRRWQFLKQELPRYFKFVNAGTERNALQSAKQKSFNVSIDEDISTEVRLAHLTKQFSGKDFIDSGSFMNSKDEHDLKQSSPITVTDSGIFIDLSDSQYAKQFLPIAIIVLGSVTEVRILSSSRATLYSKQPSPNFVTVYTLPPTVMVSGTTTSV